MKKFDKYSLDIRLGSRKDRQSLSYAQIIFSEFFQLPTLQIERVQFYP